MKILAIHDGHNATACYLKDGEIVSMVLEERFTNIKNQGGYPENSIEWILSVNSMQYDSFDYIVFPHLVPPLDMSDVYINPTVKMKLFSLLNKMLPITIVGSKKLIGPYIRIFGKKRKNTIINYACKYGFDFNKVVNVEHHTAHAYSSIFGSGFTDKYDKILVFTSDNSGDGLANTVGIWEKGNSFKRLQEQQTFHSLGELYSRATQYLGMKPGEHEYKLMGMQPYVPDKYSNKVINILDKYFGFDEDGGKIINKKLYGYQILREFKKDLFLERFDNIAGGFQRHFEKIILKWVKYWARETGIRVAVFGGGSFMNVKVNMLIIDLDYLDDVFFFPSSGDESTALGAAFKVAADNSEKITPLYSLYKGPKFSNSYIEAILDKYSNKIEWVKKDDIEKDVAELITRGMIVARFKGPSEWGARALGGRSILCRGDDLKVIHKLNKSIKMRDFWMPFAASILEEDQNKYLENPKEIQAPFMILSFHTTENAHTEIAAGLHPFDKTCRPQVVYADTNPTYHKLLSYYKEMTGFSGLLNTSFNLHGSPIVGTPELAIDTLLNSKIDYLALEDYLLKPRPSIQPEN